MFLTGVAALASALVPEAGLAARPAVALAEEPTVTGEEDEQAVFTGDGVLYEFDDSKQWRERGRGEMKVNVGPSGTLGLHAGQSQHCHTAPADAAHHWCMLSGHAGCLAGLVK